MANAVETPSQNNLMTEGSIVKSLLLFALPLIFGNLLQQLYNTADSIIVGNFVGANALAAVGSSGSPIYLLIGFSQGVAVGAGVVVSQYLGAKDKKETRIAVHTSLAIAVILGLILTVGGIAVMVETLTDNRNRTAANMRHYFDKFGGNLGQMGCVGFMFTQKGVIVVDLEDKDPDELMMDALDAGADDFDAGEDAAEVTTSPENFTAVCDALEKKGYKFISADVAQVPSTTTTLTDPDQLVQMGKLLDALDDDDDVQNAWHTLENEEDLDR